MSEIEYVTIRELIAELEHCADCLGDDTAVLLASDPEGNTYRPFAELDEMISDAQENLTPGKEVETIYAPTDPEAGDLHPRRVIVLYP